MSNIVLIGMPGSGKSTIGVLAAKALGFAFLDSDIALQSRLGCLLQPYIDRHGIDQFLDEEQACILSLHAQSTLIATGGSVVLRDSAMCALAHGAAQVIYLHLPADCVMERLVNIRTRGIAMRKGQTIGDLYAQRDPLYKRYATDILPCEGLGIESCVDALVRLVLNKNPRG